MKAPLRFALASMLFIGWGCSHTRPTLTLAHEIQVPKKWRGGGSDPMFPHLSDISRYTTDYERAWWWCVVSYAKDIEFRPQCSDSLISGWPAATHGWADGLEAADAHLQRLILAHGKQRVARYLLPVKDAALVGAFE